MHVFHTAFSLPPTQGCSPDFEWGNFYIGLTDVALDKSGLGCYQSTMKIIQSAEDLAGILCDDEQSLRKLIVFLCTDGASSMRSTPFYAGLDVKPDGDSFVACFKKNHKPLIGNLHGTCHNLNLGLKEALTKTTHNWAEVWLLHVRAMFNWFSKSPARKARFKHLSDQFQILGQAVTWRMVYPRYYCPTRWVGIIVALQSICAAKDLHVEYCRDLITKGFTADRSADNDVPPEDEVRDALL